MDALDPRTYVRAQPDVEQRMMLEALSAGPIYKIARMVSRGPLCPMAIFWLSTWFEPGCPENRDMERSPQVVGLISGQWADPVRLFTTRKPGTMTISRQRYEALVAEIRENIAHNRYDARSEPYHDVDLERVGIPFS